MILLLLKRKALLLLQYASAALVPLVLTPHILKSIGLERFGQFSVLLAISAYVTATVQYAFPLQGPVELERSPNEPARVFVDILSAKALIFAILGLGCAAYVGLSEALRPDWGAYLMLLILPPLAAAANCTWFLQAKSDFLVPSLIGIAGTVAAVLVGMRWVGADSSLVWPALAITLGTLVSGVGTFVYTLVSRAEISSFCLRGASWLGACGSLKRGGPLFISQFISLLYTGAGTLVVAKLHGLPEAGVYGAMERIMNAVLGGMLLIHVASYPTLIQLFAEDRRKYLRLIQIVVFGYLVSVAVLLGSAMTMSEQILHFIYGDHAAPKLLLLLAGVWIASGIFGPALTGYLTVAGATRRVVRVNVLVVIVSLCCGIPAAYWFGGVGWMGAILIGQCVVLWEGVKCFRHEHRELGMRPESC